MPLPKDYAGQHCSLSRALEIVGERWTLLIIRDAFFGVRRFGDFAAHLGLPRAVLAERLASLTADGVLAGCPGSHGHDEYVLTGKGLTLWPVVRSLLAWGDEYYSEVGPRRVFQHAADGGLVDAAGTCAGCGGAVPVQDLLVAPGPGLATRPGRGGRPGRAGRPGRPDPVSVALASPHRLLEPVRG